MQLVGLVAACLQFADDVLDALQMIAMRDEHCVRRVDDHQIFDTDRMVWMMQEITNRIAGEGNAVLVGRGAPYFLREHADAFHVFLYAPRAEKIRRTMADGHSQAEAEELVDLVDRERIAARVGLDRRVLDREPEEPRTNRVHSGRRPDVEQLRPPREADAGEWIGIAGAALGRLVCVLV